ncbi:hypothetical protein FEM48_Zijuj05G0006100 [Ziziphus jujuba var. spinosa]|uniref:F-box domain-containing protein n=1 Tax=Ziziphus jujuba var. spinosa TaxID=714518 RepID=A0A978VBS2_ZIZJJ|nr:hypothetical protein FEM48_Zijuj05G0006100 [Ziziphus jujuba var. spinosa]
MDHNKISKALRPYSAELSCLPEEVKVNILSRLPVKLLCQCRSVSKEWLGLISSPFFRSVHMEISKENHMLLLLDSDGDDLDEDDEDEDGIQENADLQNNEANNEEMGQINHPDEVVQVGYKIKSMPGIRPICFTAMDLKGVIEYMFSIPVDGKFDMLPSNHGLVCFNNNGNFHVYNPSTQAFLALPAASASTCDETVSTFGYLPSTKEYKLAHMYDRSMSLYINDIGCEIYTLSAGTTPGEITAVQPFWKQIKEKCPFAVDGKGVLANNVFYWLIWDDHADRENKLVLSLDLEEEKFKVVPHPPVISRTSNPIAHDIQLIELRGNLCLVGSYADPPVMDIWMLETDGSNIAWTKEYSLDLSLLDDFDIHSTQIGVVGYHNGEIIVDSGTEGLDFYNVETQTFRRQFNMNFKTNTKLCLYTDCFATF